MTQKPIEQNFQEKVIRLIRNIPSGMVATYGQIAKCAGNPRGARQVSYILHALSGKEKLPWHRVINSKGGISLKPRHGYELQKQLLEDEGIVFDDDDRVDLKRFGWLNQGRLDK
ncbi:MAG: MGMT family protein [candidate division WOR-3 bacterium]|nr:MAG: MGMT family protein [candidate division WOR-3 bacterium]